MTPRTPEEREAEMEALAASLDLAAPDVEALAQRLLKITREIRQATRKT